MRELVEFVVYYGPGEIHVDESGSVNLSSFSQCKLTMRDPEKASTKSLRKWLTGVFGLDPEVYSVTVQAYFIKSRNNIRWALYPLNASGVWRDWLRVSRARKGSHFLFVQPIEKEQRSDRISRLSDELLHRVLSFLPARDAVRTCVLACRWRHLWLSVRRLNVNTTGFTSDARFTQFVSNLLLRRGNAPLDTFWLCADGPRILLDNFRGTANLWIYHVLRCNVQALGIADHNLEKEYREEEFLRTFYPDHYPFTSTHLKRLHLCFVCVRSYFIKQLFSGCPALEDLGIEDCDITATDFSSTTLKNLSIDRVGYSEGNEDFVDIVINMPSLVSLHIGSLLCMKPSFLNLKSLLTASITLEQCGFRFDVGCYILHAFSNARNLELLSTQAMEGEKFLGNDMLFCQVVFTNLITLSLGDWCLHHSCEALLYVLKHSPNLEKLTLNFSNVVALQYSSRPLSNVAMKMDPPCERTVTPFNCKKLKEISIICPKRDKRVGVVAAILCANLISLPEINIKPS